MDMLIYWVYIEKDWERIDPRTVCIENWELKELNGTLTL